MAKDRGGHGSEKRGVSAVQARNDRMFAMFERAKAQGHTGLYSGPAAPSGGGQPVASNAHAAATLASGPKSAAVDTHPSMTPHVVADTSVPGATHALVRDDGKVVGRLYKSGSPAWR